MGQPATKSPEYPKRTRGVDPAHGLDDEAS